MASRKEIEKRKVQMTSAKAWAEKQGQGQDRSSVRLPEGTSGWFYLKKAGSYRVDFIPYVVGAGNPDADEGMGFYARKFFHHERIGVQEKNYLCPKDTFNKRCPICEEQTRLRSKGADKETTDALRSKQRMLWRVKVASQPNGVSFPTDEVLPWETGYYKTFGEMLRNKINGGDEDDRYEEFYYLDSGKTLKLSVEDDTFKGNAFRKVASIEMKERSEELDPDLIDQGPNLDEMVAASEVSYEELKKIFLQESGADDDEDQTPERNGTASAKKADPDDDGDDDEPAFKPGDLVQHAKLGDCKVIRVKGDQVKVEDEDGDEHTVDADELTASKPAPKAKAGKTATKSGLEKGDMVEHDEYGECEVMKIAADDSLTLQDEEGDMHSGVDADDCTKVKTADAPKGKGKPAADEDDLDEDDSDLEPDEPPAKPKGKGKGKGKGGKPAAKKVDPDDDDDLDDDSDLEPADEDDEDDED